MIKNATMKDVTKILELVNSYGQKGLMLTKSPYAIYKNIQEFVVYRTPENEIAGCVRLNIAWKDLAEVASLAVDEKHLKKGIGKELVNACKKRAKEIGLKRLFSLTYQTDFFAKCGFKEIERDTLPHKVFGDCLNCPKAECCDEHAFIFDL